MSAADRSKRDRTMVRLRALIATGMHDSEIATELAITKQDVVDLRLQMMKEEQDRYTGSTEETFALYAAFMSVKIRDLDRLITDMRDSDGKVRQGSAAVGAIKAQADIYEKVIKRGEELGVIKRATDGGARRLIGMGDAEIAAEIQRKLTMMNTMLGQYGSGDISTVEMEPPPGFPSVVKTKANALGKFKAPKRKAAIVRKATLPKGRD